MNVIHVYKSPLFRYFLNCPRVHIFYHTKYVNFWQTYFPIFCFWKYLLTFGMLFAHHRMQICANKKQLNIWTRKSCIVVIFPFSLFDPDFQNYWYTSINVYSSHIPFFFILSRLLKLLVLHVWEQNGKYDEILNPAFTPEFDLLLNIWGRKSSTISIK